MWIRWFPAQSPPTLVRPLVDCKQTAVVLFIGQDWKKFRVERNFNFFPFLPKLATPFIGCFGTIL
jgi:hypothetical protein